MVRFHLPPFRNLDTFVHLTLPVSFGRAATNSLFYLQHKPGDVHDPTQGVNVYAVMHSQGGRLSLSRPGLLSGQVYERCSAGSVRGHATVRLPVLIQMKHSTVYFLEFVFSTFTCCDISAFEQSDFQL